MTYYRISTLRNKTVSSSLHLKKQIGYKRGTSCCAVCGRNHLKLELDHIIPVFLGGRSVVENSQLLCYSCHTEKTLLDKKIIRLLKGAGFIERVGPTENHAHLPIEKIISYYKQLRRDILEASR